MRKIIIGIILVVVLLLSTVPSPISAASPDIDIIDIDGDGYWSGDNWYLELYPGNTVQAEIVFKNRTDETIEVELDILHSSKNTRDNIDVWWDDTRFNIEGGSTKKCTLFLEVLGDAVPGNYELEFEVTWETHKEDTPTQVIYQTKCCRPIPVNIPSSTSSWYIPDPIYYPYPMYPPLGPPPVSPNQVPFASSGWIEVLFWISVYVIGLGLIVTVVYLVLKRRRE